MPTAKATTKKTVKKVPGRSIKGITAEEVWAGFEELRKLNAETEKMLREVNAETERTLREANAKTEKTLNRAIASTEKTLNKAIGGLSNTIGALIEHVMTAGLPEKFKKFGFSFGRVTTVKWAGGENNIYTEIDGLLENGDQAMAVEVKTTLRNEDIDDHLARMERVRKYADLHGDKRDFLSAIAAGNVSKSVREYALKKGLFVIEPAGEDVKITKPVSVKVW
jgi:ElaB/YqjD/DUF883 family membrane-anchored ribosome-binding protein